MHNIEILEACRRAFSRKQINTILILTVGLTLTTAMFAVGYGYSAFSIPFKDAGQLVTIGFPIIEPFLGNVFYDNSGNISLDGVPASLFYELKERKDIFTDLAAYKGRYQEMYGRGGWTYNWTIMMSKQNISFIGYDVTDNYFDVLGVSFSGLHEWKQNSETSYPVPLIVTYGIGMKNFGYDAIGKEFDTGSSKITLLGILPAGFLSVPENRKDMGFSPLILNRIDTGIVKIIARLAPGVTPQLAEQMLYGYSDYSVAILDDPNASRIFVSPVMEKILKPTRRIALGSWLMGVLILVLCTANIAGIYLMRCNYQHGEFAMKSALGATFINLIRPMLFELFILSGIAAIIALMMVRSILTVITNMVPVSNIAFGKPASGWIVFVFLLVCMIVMVVASLTPAVIVVLKNYRREFNRSHLTMFRSQKATRTLLIISQSAIAMLLLAISSMAVRSYLALYNKDIGVDSSVLVVSVFYSWKTPGAQIGTIVNETLETLRGGDPDALVAVYDGYLFGGGGVAPPLSYRSNNVSAKGTFISPGFVRTVKGKLLAGREFNDTDRRGEVILLNNALARAEGWSPQEAVGRIIQRGHQTLTVIGVVGDFQINSWEDDNVEPYLFEPLTLNNGPLTNHTNYIVHPDALRRTGNIEQIIYKSAPETVITRNTTWDKLLNTSASGKVLASFIVVIFAIAAILIVVTGIVNTILFTITRRTREIAVHLAVGATYARVFWIIISDVVKAGIIGFILGALASWWIVKSAAHFFYNGLRYQGLPELIFMAVLMLLIIISAALIPALRILRIEISRALATE